MEYLLTALGAGGLGSVLTVVFTHLRKSRDQSNTHQDRHIQRLEKRIDAMETAHANCQKENAELRLEVGQLRGEVKQLKARLDVKE